MATQTVYITASADDATEYPDGTVVLDEYLMTTSLLNRYGFLFRGLDIPAEATVVTAALQFYTLISQPDIIQATLSGEIAPADFTVTNGDLSDRTVTTATVEWVDNMVGGWISSPDLSAIIQEIVDDPAWETGEALAIYLVIDTAAPFATILFAYDQSAGRAPRLFLEWSTPPPLEPPPGALSFAWPYDYWAEGYWPEYWPDYDEGAPSGGVAVKWMHYQRQNRRRVL